MSKIAASLLSVPALCLAAPASSARSPTAGVAVKMQDPATQRAVAAAVKAMAEAMLDIEMAPFRKAMEAAGDTQGAAKIAEHDTLRDIAGPAAGEITEEAAKRLPAMIGILGTAAAALETMLPQMAVLAKDIAAAVGRDAATASGAADDDAPTARDSSPEG